MLDKLYKKKKTDEWIKKISLSHTHTQRGILFSLNKKEILQHATT